MKVKVCGITNIEDAILCERNGADALGFIFYEKSKRYIEPDAAANIIGALSPFTFKVGVFVNSDIDEVNATADRLSLYAVQLHGDESNDYISEINFPIIKSFRIDDDFDFTSLDFFKGSYFLLDAFKENEYGGTGESFDWNKIPTAIKNKIILAGGVSSNNIERIYKEIKPAAVDLSSSLEESPGKKSKEKVLEFFNKINYLRSNNGYNDEA